MSWKMKLAQWLWPREDHSKKIAQLERTIEELNIRNRDLIARNNKLAERLATAQPRGAALDV